MFRRVFAFLMLIMAVSYTHLDVYKRQGVCSANVYQPAAVCALQ